jgi:hypothetical protein
MAAKSVEEYISSLEDWKGEIVVGLREIILSVSPEVNESIKWAQPVYEFNGPFSYIKAFKNSVNFGFWRGVDLKDPKGILQGSGEKMRHIKITKPDDIDQKAFGDFVRQAMKLNEELGDPTKGK